MPEVHNIGSNHFAHTMEYPTRAFPIIDRGSTQEIEWPYRTGRSVVIRVPFTRQAMVVGKWTGEKDEELALSEAIGVRELGAYVPNQDGRRGDTREGRQESADAQ